MYWQLATVATCQEDVAPDSFHRHKRRHNQSLLPLKILNRKRNYATDSIARGVGDYENVPLKLSVIGLMVLPESISQEHLDESAYGPSPSATQPVIRWTADRSVAKSAIGAKVALDAHSTCPTHL